MPDIETNEENADVQKSRKVQREWLSATEAMQYLGVSRNTLYHLMDSGLLKFYIIRGVQKRRIRKEDLDALFEEGKTTVKKERARGRTKRKVAK